MINVAGYIKGVRDDDSPIFYSLSFKLTPRPTDQMPNDANSLFKCIGAHVGKSAAAVRKDVCRVLRLNWGMFPSHLRGTTNPFDHLKEMKVDGTPGGPMELYAAGMAYHLDITVCSTTSGERTTVRGDWIPKGQTCRLRLDPGTMQYTNDSDARPQDLSLFLPAPTIQQHYRPADELADAGTSHNLSQEGNIPGNSHASLQVDEADWFSRDVAETYMRACKQQDSAFVTQEKQHYRTLAQVLDAVDGVRPAQVFVLDTEEGNRSHVIKLSKHAAFYTDGFETIVPLIREPIGVINIAKTVHFGALRDYVGGLFAALSKKDNHPYGIYFYVSVCLKPSATAQLLLEKSGVSYPTNATATDAVDAIVEMANKYKVKIRTQRIRNSNFSEVGTSRLLASSDIHDASFSTKIYIKCRLKPTVSSPKLCFTSQT
jgi:hypothetical protein